MTTATYHASPINKNTKTKKRTNNHFQKNSTYTSAPWPLRSAVSIYPIVIDLQLSLIDKAVPAALQSVLGLALSRAVYRCKGSGEQL